MNEFYHNTDNSHYDEKLIPEWFYLPYFDVGEEYREFKNICLLISTYTQSLTIMRSLRECLPWLL